MYHDIRHQRTLFFPRRPTPPFLPYPSHSETQHLLRLLSVHLGRLDPLARLVLLSDGEAGDACVFRAARRKGERERSEWAVSFIPIAGERAKWKAGCTSG